MADGACALPARVLAAAVLLAGLAASGQEAGEAAGAGRPPNLVLILTDDQRWDALGCTGSGRVPTPNLDRLAREGVLFQNAVVTTPKCCPSRASILTGRYPHGAGVLGNEPPEDVLEEQLTFPEVLQAAGYETAFIGKWHLPNPGGMPQKGFDRWVSFEGHGRYHGQALNVDGQRVRAQVHLADELTRYAIEWLRAGREKPFLLFLSYKNCHSPYRPPQRHKEALADLEIELPASFFDPPEELPWHVAKLRQRDKTENRRAQPERYLASLRDYLRLVVSVDESVGQLCEVLEQQGLFDRTLTLFLSDNGFFFGEHGLMQKGKLYEPALRVPMLARLPGEIPAGSRVSAPVLQLDVPVTLLELAGAPVPEPMRGRSLAELWRAPGGSSPTWREHTLHYSPLRPNYEAPQDLALRGGGFKYMRYRTGEIEEVLFDLESDPDERVDLAGEEEHAETLAEMRRRLREEMGRVGLPDSWWEPVPEVIVEKPPNPYGKK